MKGYDESGKTPREKTIGSSVCGRKGHLSLSDRLARTGTGNLVDKFDAENFKRANARGSANLNFISLALADQSARDGRTDRDLTVLRLRLMIADDFVYHLVPGIAIRQTDGRSKKNLVAGQLGNINHLGPGNLVFHLADLHIE